MGPGAHRPRDAAPHGPGKWPPDLLARLLREYAPADDPDLLVGPRVGEDAAVVRAGAGPWVLASDPVTFASGRIGYWAAVVNANDVAATGARPRFFIATCLLPVDTGVDAVEALFRDLAEGCRATGATLVGGHTERTAGLDRPIVSGTMIGDLEGRPALATGGAKSGDRAILTRGAAIEATALIASERADRLAGKVDEATLARARDFLMDPGISIVEDARIAGAAGARALHDVTEGGVIAGLWEMAEASGLGLDVDACAIPIRPETRAVCGAAGIDPLRAIGSGSLVIAAGEDEAVRIVGALAEKGIEAAVVGRFTRPGEPHRLIHEGRTEALEPPDADAVAALF